MDEWFLNVVRLGWNSKDINVCQYITCLLQCRREHECVEVCGACEVHRERGRQPSDANSPLGSHGLWVGILADPTPTHLEALFGRNYVFEKFSRVRTWGNSMPNYRLPGAKKTMTEL